MVKYRYVSGNNMRDVDSEIVATYLETEGYFVRLSVMYDPTKPIADIDILAVHPITGDKLWGEVKVWLESKQKWPKSWDKYIEGDKYREGAFTKAKEQYVRTVLGNNFRKVCYLPLSRASEDLKQRMKSKGIDTFDISDIAENLKEKSKVAPLSITDKALRLLKILEMTDRL